MSDMRSELKGVVSPELDLARREGILGGGGQWQRMLDDVPDDTGSMSSAQPGKRETWKTKAGDVLTLKILNFDITNDAREYAVNKTLSDLYREKGAPKDRAEIQARS